MAKKRSDSNSVQGQKDIIEDSKKVVKPLPGYEPKTEKEWDLWNWMTAVRPPGDWRAVDLVLIYKAISIESQINEAQKELEIEGLVIENARGTPVANPLSTVINTLQQRQMTCFSKLKMFEENDTNKRGKKVADAKNKREEFEEGSEKPRTGLLAVS